MTTARQERPALPEGWYYPDSAQVERLYAELQRELPVGHLLHGVAVEVFAAREATDDVLFRHREQPARFTIVHLSWLGRTEIDERFPMVEFDGTFEGFIAEEERLYGLTPPNDA